MGEGEPSGDIRSPEKARVESRLALRRLLLVVATTVLVALLLWQLRGGGG